MPGNMARFKAQMGHVPAAMVSMRIGHANGSKQLEEEVAAQAIKE